MYNVIFAICLFEVLSRLRAERELGKKSDIIFEKERKGEVRRSFSDMSKARKMLGFEPRYNLRKGLEKTFLWFVKQGY